MQETETGCLNYFLIKKTPTAIDIVINFILTIKVSARMKAAYIGLFSLILTSCTKIAPDEPAARIDTESCSNTLRNKLHTSN